MRLAEKRTDAEHGQGRGGNPEAQTEDRHQPDVEVVPSVAPTIIPTACVKVTNPALTKPITVMMAAVEDCITAVKIAPETTALNRPTQAVALPGGASRLRVPSSLR